MTRTPRWRPGTRASSWARTWTRCPTAAPSTVRSAWWVPWLRWTCCANAASPRPSRGGRQLLRRGGGPLRGGVRRLAGHHRRARSGPRPGARATTTGVTMAEAMRRAGHDPTHLGRDDETLARVGTFVELHVEQGRALVDLGHPVGVGSDIWPHGRWRVDVAGEANHAGTTALDEREDAMLGLAAMIIAARRAAEAQGCVATVGKVEVVPGSINAIASSATGWLDARGTDPEAVLRVVARGARRRRRLRRPGHPGVVDPHHRLRPGPGATDVDRARRAPRHRHRRRPRRRHPRQRRHPHRHALRAQPDRRVALARRVGLGRRLPRRYRGPRRRRHRPRRGGA